MTHEANTRAQVGLIEDITPRNGKLYGMLRQGNNPDAAWVFADIRANIMPNISLGYRVHELKLESSDDERGDTYRVTRWTPMEGSTVPVPADITVGVGRATSADTQYPVTILDSRKAETHMSEQAMSPAPAGGAPTVATTGRDFDAERKQRNAELVNLATLAGMPETLSDALARDLSPSQYARELQDKKIAAASSAPSAGVKLTEREDKQYSLLRAINAQVQLMAGNPRAWESARFEQEINQEFEKQIGKASRGIYVPLSLSVRAAVTGQTAGTTSLGGAGVQTTVLDLIELLRNRMVTRRLGARVLTGLTSNVTFPRQITANTLSWTGENPSTGNTNTNLTFDNVTLTPKSAMVSTAVSRQLMVQASFDADQVARDDIASVAAIGLDLAAIDGTGSSNQPTGLMRTSGVSTVTTTFGSNGAVPDWAALVDFETTLANANAPGDDGSSWKWLHTPGIRGKLKTTLKNTVNGASYLWSDNNTVAGYAAEVSKQMPSNYTAGTSTTICHGMALGYWPELLIGEFAGAVDILVDPYTVASQGMIQLHAFMMTDIAVRHGASFAISKAAKIS